MSDYTPTPWKAYAEWEITEVIGGDDEPVVRWKGFDDSERKLSTHRANARLIVEAVNNYARLQAIEKAAREFYKMNRNEFSFRTSGTWDALAAALAKEQG
jgi:hypothetical protein